MGTESTEKDKILVVLIIFLFGKGKIKIRKNQTTYLEKLGYQVIRYWNNEIIENIEGVLTDISNTLSTRERVMSAIEIPTSSPEYAERRAHRNNSSYAKIWDILDSVCDPELPGLTIWDLGILQDIKMDEADSMDPQVEVVVTPTYSGCPAVDTIISDITKALNQSGYSQVKVKVTLSPAWTTEMMSPAGRAHLKSIHIAPPSNQDIVECSVCDSNNIKLISQFGSTACKSLHQCNDCSEVFDYFKHF